MRREGEREEERIEAVWGELVEEIEPHMGYIAVLLDS